ncbi:UPF0696 protein C11orf68 homolog [Saccoglossus kowalevskii]|uniref:UPF0696 protein C11orf68 homolog n=1 Tax=Saccoglossus kowalevskii TaxID=10224 RepID=A0ABM0GXZ4_SACKO|nr:PREDICTED: UPF0696 protein C11orf68 homolog [Saccoglossus kowalevskii]
MALKQEDDIQGHRTSREVHGATTIAYRKYRREGKKAEEYAAESKADAMAEWIIFDPNKHDSVSFEDFLETNVPSQIYRQTGVGYICVKSPYGSEDARLREVLKLLQQSDRSIRYRNISHLAMAHNVISYMQTGFGWLLKPPPSDDTIYVKGLQEEWELLQQSGRPINYHTIYDLAKAHHVTCGSWLIHLDPGFKADHAWHAIATATVNAQLGTRAQITAFNSAIDDYQHVISVFNADFTDKQQVYDLENKIRAVGIKCEMKYKPYVYTQLGIYRNNKWGLRPTIYRSNYVLHQGSIIQALYD